MRQNCLTAVSYTHLDVYKRQIISRRDVKLMYHYMKIIRMQGSNSNKK